MKNRISIHWLLYGILLLRLVNSQKYRELAPSISTTKTKPVEDSVSDESESNRNKDGDPIHQVKVTRSYNKDIRETRKVNSGDTAVTKSEINGEIDSVEPYSSHTTQGSPATNHTDDHDDNEKEEEKEEKEEEEEEEKNEGNTIDFDDEGHDEDNHSNTSDNDDLERYHDRWTPPVDPEKADTGNSSQECKNWLQRAEDFVGGDYDAFSRSCDGKHTRNETHPTTFNETVPDLDMGNFFRFTIFMTLPPNWQSMGNMLDDALTAELSLALPQYRIMTDHRDYDWGPPSESIQADIMSYKVKPDMVRRDEEQWWWQYSFKYFCYIPGTRDPVDNETGREAFENVMLWLQSTEDMLKFIGNLTNQMREVSFHVQMEPPDPCFDCEYISPCYGFDCDLSPTYAPPLAPEVVKASTSPTSFPTTSPPTSAPTRLGWKPDAPLTPPTTGQIVLDTTVWDWRRYAGLALLLTTILGTVCLSQTARLRNEMQRRKDVWGNLATEEGVDELLRTGWQVRGSLMEIYDKKNLGYKDDDSMLIGGYEQKIPVGSEIAVSRTQSETLHDTVTGTTQS